MAREMFMNDDTQYKKLGRVGTAIHRMGIKCEIRKPPKTFRKTLYEGRYHSAFEWIAEFARGVWILRLVEEGLVDHCVAVDTEAGIVLDSEELHPLRLTTESLKLCGGPRSTRIKVVEMFQLTKAE